MSLFRKGSKQEREAKEREEQHTENEADVLMRETLETVERGLRVKREVREKAARFVGSLRPVGSYKPTS